MPPKPTLFQVVSNRMPPQSPPPQPLLPEPLYTAVAKPSGGRSTALPNRYLPPQKSERQRAYSASPGRPPATVLTRVCCVGGGAKCSQSSGDSSPEPSGRYAAAAAAAAADSTYRSWRGGTGESGDYWHVEQPGGSSGALSTVPTPVPLPAAVSGYEPHGRHSQAPATFQLRPDQPASFCFTGSLVEQYRRQQQQPTPSPYVRSDCGDSQVELSQRPCRGGSVEPPRNCDDIVKPAARLGNSVPSSPNNGGGSGSRLWGSFRAGANTKKPIVEKRQCSPHVKTAS
jgi:hypothetical protein